LNTAAVIGMGSIGRRHAKNLQSMGFNIVAFDPHGCNFPGSESINLTEFESAEVAIRHADIAIISSPHSSHLAHMRACVKFRRPFLVEKPIASAMHGLNDLKSEMGDLVAHVGYNLRFHPTVHRVLEHLKSGSVGRILHSTFEYGSYLPGWRPSSNYLQNYAASKDDGGIILDDIHEIDLACHIFGMPGNVQCVTANTRTLGIAHEEIADITFTEQPGCNVTHIHMDYLQRIPTRRIKMIGTQGTIECDLNAARISVFGTEKSEIYTEESYDPNVMYINEMVHFLNAVSSGKSDETLSIQAGIQSLKIALLAKKSAIQRRSGEL